MCFVYFIVLYFIRKLHANPLCHYNNIGICIVLYSIVSYCFVLFCIVLYRFVLFCIVLYCFVLFCIFLYFFVLFCFFCIFSQCNSVHFMHSFPINYTNWTQISFFRSIDLAMTYRPTTATGHKQPKSTSKAVHAPSKIERLSRRVSEFASRIRVEPSSCSTPSSEYY